MITTGARQLVVQGYGLIGYLGWSHGSPVDDERRSGWVASTKELGMQDPSLQAAIPQDMTDAANTVRPALEEFYTSLNDEQKAKLNRLGRDTAQGD